MPLLRRQFCHFATLVWVVGCDRSDRRPPPPEPPSAIYRVAGPSMNPTLWDATVVTRCDECGIETRIDETRWTSASESGSTIRCWHCGDGPLWVIDRLRPDRVGLDDSNASAWRTGDLVLIQRAGRSTDQSRHVKRIFGIPGQMIDVNATGQLTVNGSVPEILGAAAIVVDSERHRKRSRWQATEDGWWVYHHRLVPRGNLAGPILDDYPCNVGVARRLHPVDNIAIRFQKPSNVPEVDVPPELEVRYVSVDRDGGLNLAPDRPIAFRFLADTNESASKILPPGLELTRSVDYRIDGPRPINSAARYPIWLESDRYYVVGDNVPFSIDSRVWGPVSRAEIMGRAVVLSEDPRRNS